MLISIVNRNLVVQVSQEDILSILLHSQKLADASGIKRLLLTIETSGLFRPRGVSGPYSNQFEYV